MSFSLALSRRRLGAFLVAYFLLLVGTAFSQTPTCSCAYAVLCKTDEKTTSVHVVVNGFNSTTEPLKVCFERNNGGTISYWSGSEIDRFKHPSGGRLVEFKVKKTTEACSQESGKIPRPSSRVYYMCRNGRLYICTTLTDDLTVTVTHNNTATPKTTVTTPIYVNP